MIVQPRVAFVKRSVNPSPDHPRTGSMAPMLTGRTVGLREKRRADVEIFHAAFQTDPAHVSLTDVDPFVPTTLQHDLAVFERRQSEEPDPKGAHFVVQRLDDPSGAAIGSIGLWGIDLHNRTSHIGMSLLPSARGQGFGRDALEVICRYAFELRDLARVSLETLDVNAAMRATAVACGFVEEGRLRSAAWYQGRRTDEVLYGLLADEWRARQGS